MRKYLIRRAIVLFLFKYRIPKTMEELTADGEIITKDNFDLALVRKEWQCLIDAEILVPADGYPECFYLSQAIRKKLELGFSLCDNELLYGPVAIGYKLQEDELRKKLQ